MGHLTVSHLDQQSYELLKYGELLGVGNKTALGYGHIKVTISPR